MASTAIGQALSASRRRKWRHPWQTGVAWVPAAALWVAVIEAGFVNAGTPIVATTQREQARTGRDFGLNPLTGRPYFEAHVFSHDETPEIDRQIQIPLYLDPAIPLQWRSIGFDGPAGSTVPDFFKQRGAADAPKPQTEGGDISIDPDTPRGLRLLRACDLVLHQPRLALTSEILVSAFFGANSNVTQTLSVRSATPGDVLRVFAGVLATPTAIDPLAGVFEEDTFDERLISTVYLLSPPDTTPGSEPDGSWQPFVKHALFWNLNYRQPKLRILDTDPGTPFFPPLAAGAAQLVINFLTASLNDLTTQALNILTGHSLAGTFWTPTGGGHEAVFPEEIAVQQAKGFDKGARLEAERLEKLRRLNAQRLDPAFPFRTLPFDPNLLAA